MKTLIIIIGIFYTTMAYGQSCSCKNDRLLGNIISCNPILFNNNAKLYWNFNCDSSWLTFESPAGQKEIIFSLSNSLQYLTGRLGYVYIEEYKNAFLIQNNVISGCCMPPEFYLYDKFTGKIKKALGRIVFYSKDNTLPFIISVSNSKYDTTLADSPYTSLTIYNIDKAKEYRLNLPHNKIEMALKMTGESFPEYLFEEPKIDNEIVTLTYRTQKSQTTKRDSFKEISIDLTKYK